MIHGGWIAFSITSVMGLSYRSGLEHGIDEESPTHTTSICSRQVQNDTAWLVELVIPAPDRGVPLSVLMHLE